MNDSVSLMNTNLSSAKFKTAMYDIPIECRERSNLDCSGGKSTIRLKVTMLPKQYRLKKRLAFKATYKVKNSSHSGGVTLFAGVVKKEDYPTKVGFVVSKKVHKRAVKRNRLKRLMRESYRLLLKENNLGDSQKYMSLVFVGSERALGMSFDEINSSIKKILGKI